MGPRLMLRFLFLVTVQHIKEQIFRFPNSTNRAEVKGTNLVDRDESSAAPKEALASSSRIVHDSTRHAPEKVSVNRTYLLTCYLCV